MGSLPENDSFNGNTNKMHHNFLLSRTSKSPYFAKPWQRWAWMEQEESLRLRAGTVLAQHYRYGLLKAASARILSSFNKEKNKGEAYEIRSLGLLRIVIALSMYLLLEPSLVELAALPTSLNLH